MFTKDNPFWAKQAVIFDFDGTIADTFSLHEDAFKRALTPYEVSFIYNDYLGMSTDEAMLAIFQKNKKAIGADELAAVVKQKRQFANHSYQTNLQTLPGALELIRLLHANNMSLFIASSGSQMNITAGVRVLGLTPYFTAIITSADVKKAKPDPEIFQTILHQYRLASEQALVIEDAESGLLAAQQAGIDAVCINPEITCRQLALHEVQHTTYTQLITAFNSSIQHEESSGGYRNV